MQWKGKGGEEVEGKKAEREGEREKERGKGQLFRKLEMSLPGL